jgi:hypothetical protein
MDTHVHPVGRFQYNERLINPQVPEIRLVKLLPGETTDPIRCDISRVPLPERNSCNDPALSTTPNQTREEGYPRSSYDALSYT